MKIFDFKSNLRYVYFNSLLFVSIRNPRKVVFLDLITRLYECLSEGEQRMALVVPSDSLAIYFILSLKGLLIM